MRLTKDLGGIYTVGDRLIDGYTMFGEPINKLGQLEDIEEELGIDLITFAKMFIDGIYYCDAVDSITFKPVNIEKLRPIQISKEDKCLIAIKYDLNISKNTALITAHVFYLPFENFNRKGFLGWALTKEELE